MEEKKGNKKIKIKIFLSLVIGQSFRSFQLEPPQKLPKVAANFVVSSTFVVALG
jgi:formate-dependent nitrite reductase membrane component NrfD